MAIKMRNNTNLDAVCCECGENQKQVLNMFDLCIGGNIFTICDVCNEKIFTNTLRAECFKNGRVKSQHDIQIINNRKQRNGLGFYRELMAKARKEEEADNK